MYTITTLDAAKRISLGQFHTLREANEALEHPQFLFAIPIPPNLLKHYARNLSITDDRLNIPFIPRIAFSD